MQNFHIFKSISKVKKYNKMQVSKISLAASFLKTFMTVFKQQVQLPNSYSWARDSFVIVQWNHFKRSIQMSSSIRIDFIGFSREAINLSIIVDAIFNWNQMLHKNLESIDIIM